MRSDDTVPVLMYHHVSPSPGPITCTPEHFEDQLRWLAERGYRSLSSAAFGGHLDGRGVHSTSVLITCDDGYLDNWVYAHPLLKKYGFNAMLFVVTSWVCDGEVRSHNGQSDVPQTPDHFECERLIDAGQSDKVILRWSELQQMQSEGTFEVHSHTHTHTRWDKSDRAAEKNALMAEELALSREDRKSV